MKIANLLEEVVKQESFHKFIKENPDAYLNAIFVVLDNSGKDTYQLDFFIPSKNKVAISSYPFEKCIIQEDEITKSTKINLPIGVDIADLREKVDKLKIENKLEKIRIIKIIGILKDDNWNLSCISPTMDILKIVIDKKGECIKFQKSSLMDFVVKK